MSEENKKLGDEKLEHVAGGNDGQFGPIDDVHNTAYFSPHTVCNLPPGTSLVMKTYHSGGGSVMPGHRFHNGGVMYPRTALCVGRGFARLSSLAGSTHTLCPLSRGSLL